MKLKLSILLAALFGALLVPTDAIAQKPKKKNSDVQVIDFGEEEAKKGKKEPKYRGIILKTSPVSFVFGRQMFEVEKEISDLFSIQGGVGLTFAPLWENSEGVLSDLYEEDGFCESTQWEAGDECDYYNDFTIRRGAVGPLVSASGRLFFENDGYEGMYIAPLLRYSVQRYEVQKVIENQPYAERDPDEWQKESIRNFDVMVHYGNQNLFEKMTFEWFVGLGLRFRNNTRQDVGYTANGSQNGERNFKDKRLQFDAGIRVGFQL